MKGRKPQPTRLKLLRGNPGKRPLNEREPVVTSSLPDPPETLDPVGLEMWHLVAGQLAEAKILTGLDANLLARYCDMHSHFEALKARLATAGYLAKTPNDHVQPSPLWSMYRQAGEELRKMESEMGMTPTARTRVVAANTEKPAESKWAGMLP